MPFLSKRLSDFAGAPTRGLYPVFGIVIYLDRQKPLTDDFGAFYRWLHSKINIFISICISINIFIDISINIC